MYVITIMLLYFIWIILISLLRKYTEYVHEDDLF